MLIDSNIIIYAALPEHAKLRRWIAQHPPAVSSISYLEVLGYHRLTSEAREEFRRFFEAVELLPLDRPILDEAVRLRQIRRMSLGDALVAATALVYRRVLVTHNLADFQGIPDLQLLDPLASPDLDVQS